MAASSDRIGVVIGCSPNSLRMKIGGCRRALLDEVVRARLAAVDPVVDDQRVRLHLDAPVLQGRGEVLALIVDEAQGRPAAVQVLLQPLAERAGHLHAHAGVHLLL
jgi:hypothetical protein